MTERLNEIERSYEEIGQQLCIPEVFSDPKKQRELLKKQKQLTPIVEQFRSWKQWVRLEQEALEACDDPELRELARAEYQQAKQARQAAEEALRRALIPRDPDDDRSVILELRAGTGGEEAALFAGVLLRMYLMYADRHHFRTEIMSRNETQLGGIKEAVLSVEGEGVYAKLKFESGVHRVQRVPETESQGRIQTSAATVAVLPEAEEVDLQIDPKDLLIETHRSGGAGGQHVNKTESAIRIVHLPTGIEVDCQDERSQYKNKDKAMKILRSRLLEKERAEREEKIGAQRRSQVGTGDRSQRIRTYNFPQGRVTDHRIGLTLYRLSEIVDGDLDELLDALSAEEETERLKAFSKGEVAE